MIEPVNTPRKGGFRPLGSPMHPAIADALAGLLLGSLSVGSRAAFVHLIDSIGVSGMVFLLANNDRCRSKWEELTDELVINAIHKAEELRRCGSTINAFALGAKGGKP